MAKKKTKKKHQKNTSKYLVSSYKSVLLHSDKSASLYLEYTHTSPQDQSD